MVPNVSNFIAITSCLWNYMCSMWNHIVVSVDAFHFQAAKKYLVKMKTTHHQLDMAHNSQSQR